MNIYFKTGLNDENHNALELRFTYSKDSGGYGADISVGDHRTGVSFGWMIDADFFRWYQRHQFRVIVPAARRSAAKEAAAKEQFRLHALEYAREFAAAVAADGGPVMTITPEEAAA